MKQQLSPKEIGKLNFKITPKAREHFVDKGFYISVSNEAMALHYMSLGTLFFYAAQEKKLIAQKISVSELENIFRISKKRSAQIIQELYNNGYLETVTAQG